jgi:hypothetical protein
MVSMRLAFQHTLRDILEVNCAAWEQRINGWLVILIGAGIILIVMIFQGAPGVDPTPAFILAPFSF